MCNIRMLCIRRTSELKYFVDAWNKTHDFTCIQPDGGSWVPAYQMHRWAYAGNPNALYSVDELKYYVDRTVRWQDISDDLQPSGKTSLMICNRLERSQIISDVLPLVAQRCLRRGEGSPSAFTECSLLPVCCLNELQWVDTECWTCPGGGIYIRYVCFFSPGW